MKIGLHSISYAGLFYRGPGLSLEEVIDKAASLGFEGIEVMAKAPVCSPFDYDESRAKRARDYAASRGLELCFLAAYLDLNRPDRLDGEKEMVYAKDNIRLARDLGCSHVRVYSGGDHVYQGASLWQQWDWTVENVQRLLPIAQEHGVRLAMEVHTGVAQTTDALHAMMRQIGWDEVDMCTGPAILSLHGEPVAATVQGFGAKLVHSHVMDFADLAPVVQYHDLRGLATNPFPRLNNVPMGQGKVENEAFMRACYEIGYQGYFAYEICTPFHVAYRKPTLEDIDRMVGHAVGWLKDTREHITG